MLLRLLRATPKIYRAAKAKMAPSVRSSWPFDARRGFFNLEEGVIYEIKLDGQVISACAASPATGHVLLFKRDRRGNLTGSPQPCVCRIGWHDYEPGENVCFPLEVLKGKVEVLKGKVEEVFKT